MNREGSLHLVGNTGGQSEPEYSVMFSEFRGGGASGLGKIRAGFEQASAGSETQIACAPVPKICVQHHSLGTTLGTVS
jgi:hypothetical protein